MRPKVKGRQFEVNPQGDENTDKTLDIKIAEYDKDPAYITVHIGCAYQKTDKGGFINANEWSVFVDLEHVTSEINRACKDLHIRGYEVISILDVIGGVGVGRSPSGTLKSYTYGHSVTTGVIITAKKIIT